MGRWYDWKAKFAEDYLNEAIVALAGAAALAKHIGAPKRKNGQVSGQSKNSCGSAKKFVVKET